MTIVSQRTLKRRNATRDESVPKDGSLAKRDRTNLGLELLCYHALPGVRYSRDEIAIWAGCTDTAILAIEVKALKKLRHRLLFMKDAALVEMIDGLFDAREPASKRRHFE